MEFYAVKKHWQFRKYTLSGTAIYFQQLEKFSEQKECGNGAKRNFRKNTCLVSSYRSEELSSETQYVENFFDLLIST
ncbi:Uncharacterized protein dnm_094110 [Desulfonema magnum]|uniref:Uncharacterized protein n=1 Tax=Desulfonema magnum TaxID=45655 RepID=A0A975BYA1_9BACT|nr:Uncharacterized protein dnm_094110 [Desulfonema magnum]